MNEETYNTEKQSLLKQRSLVADLLNQSTLVTEHSADIDSATIKNLVSTLNLAKKLDLSNYSESMDAESIDRLINVLSNGFLKIIQKVAAPRGMNVKTFYKPSDGSEFSLDYFTDSTSIDKGVTITGFRIPVGKVFTFNDIKKTTMDSNTKITPTTVDEALKLGRGGEFAVEGTPAHLAALQNSAAQAYTDFNDELVYKEHVNKALGAIIGSVENVVLKQTIIKELVEKYAQKHNLVLLGIDHIPPNGINDTNEDPTPGDAEDGPAEIAPVEYCWEQLIQNFLNDPLTHEPAFKLAVRDPLKVLKEFRILTLNGPRQRGKTEAALATVRFDSDARLINAGNDECSRGYSDARATSIVTKRTLDIRKDGISADTFKNVTVLVIHQDGYPLDKCNPLEEVLYYFENNPTNFHPDFKIVVIG